MSEPRYVPYDPGDERDPATVKCGDCGGLVADQKAHDRFHAILSGYVPVIFPDPYPERRSPDYCWRSWPPRHTGECGCGRAEVMATLPDDEDSGEP